MKVAVITPYHNEPDEVLRRCAMSVLAQTVAVDHIWVADGDTRFDTRPHWSDGGRLIRLDQAHEDYGNVARGVGALLAAGEQYDAIAFLDADNWYDPTHVAECLALAAVQPNLDVVFARRRFCRPDGTDMGIPEESNHVDTSCYFFLPGSYPCLAYWATMPKPMVCIGDRIIYSLLMSTTGLTVAKVPSVTVNYLCMWESLYRARGETPPPGAKPNIDAQNFELWRSTLKGRKLDLANRLSGVRLK